MAATLDFALPTTLEAHEPPEARGLGRDGVRLLVGWRATGKVAHRAFTDLPDLLRAGDVLVVNTSATLPAAVPVPDVPRRAQPEPQFGGGEHAPSSSARAQPEPQFGGGEHAPSSPGLAVHFSTALPDGTWLVELREAGGKTQHAGGAPDAHYRLPGGGALTLREPYSQGRLWVAAVSTGAAPDVPAFLHRYGRPIRYGYVSRPWPLAYYQTVFATEPGSAEMPSAARPFTHRLVTRLVAAGVLVLPVLLHTGVASPEAHERPYPERFAVPPTTARLVNHARAHGGRVVAVGTTAVRALESAAGDNGAVAAARGWTDLVVTPDRGVRVVDGLITGLHEPHASHLQMLAAIAGEHLLDRCYAEAVTAGYLWHEFGDSNLLLP